jgi:hypothetical protein
VPIERRRELNHKREPTNERTIDSTKAFGPPQTGNSALFRTPELQRTQQRDPGMAYKEKHFKGAIAEVLRDSSDGGDGVGHKGRDRARVSAGWEASVSPI